MTRALWIVGMVGSVAGALVGAGLPEPYHDVVMLVGVIAAAITGFNVEHPLPKWDGVDRRKRIPSYDIVVHAAATTADVSIGGKE